MRNDFFLLLLVGGGKACELCLGSPFFFFLGGGTGNGDDDDSQQQLQLGTFLNDMLAHFADEGPRTPIVCDDVTYAYVVAGVAISNDDAINSLLPDGFETV